MNRNTIRTAIIAIVAVTIWRMVAPKVPGLSRFAG